MSATEEKIKFDKYRNEEGQVAVLVSYGYGAGWSTWSNPEDFLAMDKGLVELKMKKAGVGEVESYLKDKLGDIPYMGGWFQVEIEWLDEGAAFEISEYDGSESIRLISSLNLTA